MKFDVVIQARMGSDRMQGKVLKIYKKFSILDILIKRIKKLDLINKIIVTTTTKKKDNRIVNFCKKIKFHILEVLKKMCSLDTMKQQRNSN